MSKNFADCKDEVLDVLYSCFLYLCMMQLIAELRHESTKNEVLLIRLLLLPCCAATDGYRLMARELGARALTSLQVF